MIPPLPPLPPPSPADALGPITAPSAAPAGAAPSFAQALHGALDQMEQLQSSATQQVSQLVGGGSEDVHAGMIAVEKADLAFGMMLQLRNKAVQAYQDISHMAF